MVNQLFDELLAYGFKASNLDERTCEHSSLGPPQAGLQGDFRVHRIGVT